MTFWAILLLLVLVAALVAYVGDQVAKRVGKRHWRFFGLRPRATATLVAVGTGVLIALGGFGTFFLLVRDARETILQADQVRQERNRLRDEVARLESRAAATLTDTNRLKSERDEFERNNKRLADQLEQYALQQKDTRQQLLDTLVEQQKLSLEAEKLRKASERQKLDLQKLEQGRQVLLAERQTLQKEKAQLLGEKTQLLASRTQVALQAQQAEQRLRDLQAASKTALTRYTSLQNQTKVLQARTKALQNQTSELQTRIADLEGDKTKLESDKRDLEGDVAVLVSSKDGTAAKGAVTVAVANANLEALQKENNTLRESLGNAQRELQQLRDRSKLMVGSLNKTLNAYLLAEEDFLEASNAADSLAELVHKAENRSRLLGLRGLEITEFPNLSGAVGGLLLARVIGINADGRVRIRVEYRAKEQRFAAGDVLATTGLILPAGAAEMQRKLAFLNQAAADRLVQAGWVPEKISPDGISVDALVGLMAQMSGKRGGAKIAVVALENLYPTEQPKLGLELLP